MSCDAVALSALLWLAAASPTSGTAPGPVAIERPQSVASEPLFVDIVGRAGRLRTQTDAFSRADLNGDISQLPGFASYKASIGELADLDMKGHVVLAARGTDGDLKCILKGISLDLPLKLKALEEATSAKTRVAAMKDLSYLLRDNVEVITSPPAPAA
jgi:hypothetical protein